MKKTNVVLVDANSFVYKSYFGYKKSNEIIDKYKILTGLMQCLYDIVKNIDNISHLYFVFDPIDNDLYRKSLFSLYKENRPKTPEDLIEQKTFAKNVLKDKVGIPIIEYGGYEADDAIGSLSKYYENDYNVIIVSPDKDLFQLVNNSTMLLRPTKKEGNKVYEYISKIGVERYFGVKPEQIPDYLALVGDTCDNLPGVDNVGKTTAAYLLKKYNNIEDMYSVINEVKSVETSYIKLLNQFEQNIEFIKLIKLLAVIKSDLNIEKHIVESLKLATDIQSTPSYYSRIENMASEYQWKPHFYNFLKS